MTTKTAGELREIPLEDLKVHGANPRTDVGDLSDLVSSIKERGVQEPILVVAENGHFAIVAGRRRFEASKKAGRATVPAIVRDLSPEDVATVSLIENLQRKDLGPLEEAEAYRAWLTVTGKSQRDLAVAVGKDESTISNALRLLKAPQPVKDALREQRISAAHARVVLELKDPGVVSKLPLDKPMTVDALKEQVTRLNGDYDITGPGAVEKAKAALADVQKKHPNATIVWRAVQGYYANEALSLPKALGRSPAAVAGHVVEGGIHRGGGVTSVKRHAEICDCNAIELEAHAAWSTRGRVLNFTTRRVCIKPANFKKVLQAPRSKAKKTGPKKPSAAAIAKREAAAAQKAAEKEKAERTGAETQVAHEFRLIQAAPGKEAAPVIKKIGKAISADVARAIVIRHLAVDGALYELRAVAMAWERIFEMPAKKVGALAIAILAKDIAEEFGRPRSYGRDAELDHLQNGIRSYFGLKVREPKAKKKAKR